MCHVSPIESNTWGTLKKIELTFRFIIIALRSAGGFALCTELCTAKKSAFFYPLPLVGHYLCIKDGDYLIGSNDII